MTVILFFVLGAVLGSFILLMVDRMYKGEEWLIARSKCLQCLKKLGLEDLIPIVSFFILKGKCGNCKKPLTRWYIIVEVLLGLLFVFALYFVPQVGLGDLFIRLFILSLLFALFLFDFKYSVLPDMLTLPGIIFIALYSFLSDVPLSNLLVAAIIGGGVFYVQWIVSGKKWVGAGDIRLGVLMGVILGFPHILTALFLAYVVGAIVSVGLIIGKVKKVHDAIPFGVFLIPATIVVMFWGTSIFQIFS